MKKTFPYFLRFSFACVPKHLHKTALMNWWNRHRKSGKERIHQGTLSLLQAYNAFATQENYAQAVKCGVNASALYHRENYYKEAFELLRNAELLVRTGEQKLKRTFLIYVSASTKNVCKCTSASKPHPCQRTVKQTGRNSQSCPKWLSKQRLSVYPSQLLLHFRHEFAGRYSFQETDRTV